MKLHRKRIRLLKGLALVGCAVGLAVPSVAGAMLADGPLNPGDRGAATNITTYHNHGRAVVGDYTLPSTFKTDAQTQVAGAGSRTFVLSSTHQSDVPSATPAATSSNPSPVVREIRTVTHDGSRTLAIVLASAALGIALCGTGYALSRVAVLQRRQLGSSS
jgi:hypothetical protein